LRKSRRHICSATPARFERATVTFEGCCSDPLSYGVMPRIIAGRQSHFSGIAVVSYATQ
jgi:hypothetical protein